MPYEHLLCDLWATSPAVLGEDTSFLAELVYGHLIHHFSTPASFMTWDENIPHRIQKLLRTVADNFPQVKPTSAIRTLLVVLSVKKDAPGAVAFNDDIELLYMMAFKHIAGFYDYAFTPSVFDVLTDLRYVGTKMDHYPSYLKHHLDQSLHNDHRPKVDAKIIDFLKFYLAPFLPAYVEGRVDESPEMPAFVDLKRLEPARGKQTLVFPDSMRKLTPLSPVVEEEPATPESSIAFFDVVLYEATPKGTVADKEVNALVDSETSSSFATTVDMSLLDDPFDEESLASSSSSATSSLTIVSTVAAGSAGESKLCEELEPAILATVAPDRGTSEMVGSPSSATASSMLPPPLRGGSLSHNPASQLNAVFSVPESHPIAKDVAKHPSSERNITDYTYDPFPDLYPTFRTDPAHRRLTKPKPPPITRRTTSFPLKQVRQWQANRRGSKSFSSQSRGVSSSSSSSDSKKTKKLRLKVVGVFGRRRDSNDHGDDGASARLLREGDFQRKWKRSSSKPWKRILFLPIAFVRLRLQDVYYGYK